VAKEEESTLDTILDLKRRDPFLAFSIVMTSGDRYVIEDPDALAIGGSQLHYYPARSDKAIHMRLNQIAAVEEISQRPPTRRKKSA
jgi:hypothetical protein